MFRVCWCVVADFESLGGDCDFNVDVTGFCVGEVLGFVHDEVEREFVVSYCVDVCCDFIEDFVKGVKVCKDEDGSLHDRLDCFGVSHQGICLVPYLDEVVVLVLQVGVCVGLVSG